MTEGYCVKCKSKREMKNEEQFSMAKTNKPAVRGNCSVCNTKMVKILPSKPKEAAPQAAAAPSG